MEYTQQTPAPGSLFHIVERGYDYGQVDRYIQKLQGEYTALFASYEKLGQYVNTLQNRNAYLERETQRTAGQNVGREAIADTLLQAQAMAQSIVTQAKFEADQQSAEARKQLDLLLMERERISGAIDVACKKVMEMMETMSGE
jgi:cell division septum initiation protein DivIVA